MTSLSGKVIVLVVILSVLVAGCGGGESEHDESHGESTSEIVAQTPSNSTEARLDEEALDPVDPEATPTLTLNSGQSMEATRSPRTQSSTPASAGDSVVPGGWNSYYSEKLGLSISFPGEWPTVSEVDGRVFLANIEGADCGSCRTHPSGTVTVTIMPNVDPPFAQGERITVGVDDHQASLFRQDPWGYREPDRIIDVFYGAGSTTWLIRATFTEPANDATPNVEDFFGVLEGIQHDDVAISPELAPANLPLYDRESVYQYRISRDVTNLRTSLEELETLLQAEERSDPEWQDQVSDPVEPLGRLYEETLPLEPPESYRSFHSDYLKALFYFAASEIAVQSSDALFTNIFLTLAGDNIRTAYEQWPEPYEPHQIDPAADVFEATTRIRRYMPVGGLFREYLWQQFSVRGALLTLHRLHLPSDEADILIQGENGVVKHVRFAVEYSSGLAGQESSVSRIGFEDVGSIIEDFVVGSGEWTTTQAYRQVAIGVERREHELEYHGIIGVIKATSHTMSDQRRGIILSTFQTLYDDYRRSFLTNDRYETFSDFIAANASDTILARYGWEFDG